MAKSQTAKLKAKKTTELRNSPRQRVIAESGGKAITKQNKRKLKKDKFIDSKFQPARDSYRIAF
jgi:hypothetical protein